MRVRCTQLPKSAAIGKDLEGMRGDGARLTRRERESSCFLRRRSDCDEEPAGGH